MRKLITSHGQFNVVEETLTDRSKVYSVIFDSADGGEVILACCGEKPADTLAFFLQSAVVDVSTRDKEGMLS